MKKIIILLSVAVAALAVSCNKVTPQDSTPDAPKGETITITVSLSDALTKVSLTQDSDPDGAIKVAWENTDKICVIDADNPASSSEFSIASIDSDKPYIATFTGTAVPASKYDILYGAESVAAAEAIDLSEQYQSGGNASLGHLKYMAILENVEISNFVTDPIEFSKSWAETHGGVFKQNGVLRLRLQTPAGVSFVSSVSITPSQELFFKDNSRSAYTPSIKITFPENTAQQEHIITAYAMLPWGDAVDLPAGATLTIDIETDEQDIYSTTITPGAISFKPGQTNAIKLAASRFALQPFAGGNGTESNPYLIANATHMMNMDANMPRGQVTWFKLIADIDMSGKAWESLNNVAESNKYNKYINFDGNSKTISNLTPDPSKPYPSLFGVLQGCVKDLTIDNAKINNPGNNKSGVFAGYIGTGSDYTGAKVIDNIHVKNSTVEGGTNFCGGFAAHLNQPGYSITNCSVEKTTVSTAGYCAGFIAYFQQSATLSDITVSSTDVTSSGHSNGNSFPNDGLAGGISARIISAVVFDRCTYSNGTVLGPTLLSSDVNSQSPRYVGGLVGYVATSATSTFDDCHVSSATIGLTDAPGTNNGRYVGGAFGYLGSNTIVGQSIGCSVEGLSTNNNVRNYIAGFVSLLEGGTIKNSTSSSTTVIGNANYSGAAGGFIGLCKGGTLYNNSASVNIQGAGNPGGFVGWVESASASFEKCHATGSISAGANNAGGFCGIVKIGSTFTECYSTGNVSSTGGYVGGLIGYINADDVIVTKCYSISKITAVGNYVGGLIGVSESDTIEKCYYNGSVTGASRVGGILGISLKDDAVTIKNCFSRGSVTGSESEQRFGGIVGDLGKGGIVKDCWSDATVYGGRVCGGIVGLACYQTWADNTAANNNVTRCIAWNPSVKAKQLGSYGSSGAIIGHTSFTNIFNKGYRRSDMEYSNSNQDVSACITAMVDQPDCDGTNWVGGVIPGTGSGNSNQNPYYGVAAAADATVSSVAQTIGWDASTWDFSGDYPTLLK
ncbi:MAG: hypothetical protein J6S97_00415 [Bacteroidales bacterium]|nr:hypothetical protein [Bacteroidales bacterium]